jgi:two-component system, chemotaxis family, protein-glutamate methylesterase/glutaminase
MRKTRVLIVDDAAVIRRVITEALAADPAIEVAGEAENGRIALQMIPQVKPDLVTLDLELPELDGLRTLREIRKSYPRLPVIMFSAFTERGASDTLEALHSGASDYVAKPATSGGKALARERICQDLIPKIRSLCHVDSPLDAADPHTRLSPAPFLMRPLGRPTRADVVAMALSTGGPTALQIVLGGLAAGFRAPILVVQHMPNMYTRMLAQRLNEQTALTVVEAEDDMPVQAGTVYVARGDAPLTVRKKEGGQIVTALGHGQPEHSRRPSADVLFRSVADVYGAHALALVLTGMGEDGLKGSEFITRAGGRVVVQDEVTSTVWEMPGRVVHAGLADAVLPIGDIAAELVRRTAPGRDADLLPALAKRAAPRSFTGDLS